MCVNWSWLTFRFLVCGFSTGLWRPQKTLENGSWFKLNLKRRDSNSWPSRNGSYLPTTPTRVVQVRKMYDWNNFCRWQRCFLWKFLYLRQIEFFKSAIRQWCFRSKMPIFKTNGIFLPAIWQRCFQSKISKVQTNGVFLLASSTNLHYCMYH